MDRNLHPLHRRPFLPGQARKSLWIETFSSHKIAIGVFGQARKSLWIETTDAGYFVKPIFGQARKSLWIET